MMDIKYLDAKQLSFYEGLSALMKNTTLDEQKYYLTFNLLSSAAPYLSDPFVAADFDFYGRRCPAVKSSSHAGNVPCLR